MSNIQILFGTELKKQLERLVSKKMLSTWAYSFYLSNCKNISKTFELDIMKIVAMEESPEFDLTTSELTLIAEKSIKG